MAATDGPAGGFADPMLLDKIDKLFACNVGEYIDLPMLVVVGDQSSGKSSVLEGLTNLPFPRDSGLCTRFATQITFRRSADTKITISIIPAKDAVPDHAEKVRAWVRSDLQTLDAKSFAGIMKEVHTVMGLSDQKGTNRDTQATFSEDVLHLDLYGPEQEHLSVIDVPGIFKKTTQGITTREDMQMVRSMVHNYMKNPRSVMLTVIPANVDIATQEILEMAEEVDPIGQRTLGVLTKPDLVDKGAEQSVVDLIEGKRHSLTLGWAITRNLGQKELEVTPELRNSIEKSFFNQVSPWNMLEKDKVGVHALRLRLQEILADHIRKEFPKVKSEINKRLTACKLSLDRLGAERETSADQMKFLLDIAMRFQEIVSHTLATNYGADDLFDRHEVLRLPTKIVKRNDIFSDTIEKLGHTYKFDFDSPDDASSPMQEVSACPPVAREAVAHSPYEAKMAKAESEESHSYACVVIDCTANVPESFPELSDITYHGDKRLAEPIGKGILAWLTDVYENSRGFELGTFDASLLAITMKQQSKKWDAIALGYISDVVTATHCYIVFLLKEICPNERVSGTLVSILMDELVGTYKRAIEHVKFILQVERTEMPLTLNHYFNDNLNKCRQKRLTNALSQLSHYDQRNTKVVPLDALMRNHPMSNTAHTVQEIHDILNSYYKVARKRFVDTLWMQGAAHHLITGPNTPLKLFSPAFVNGMTPEQLEEVAGEDFATKRRRKLLKKERDDLEAGKEILI